MMAIDIYQKEYLMINLSEINKKLNTMDDIFSDISLINKEYLYEFINELKRIMFPKIFIPHLTINQLYIELEETLEILNCQNINQTLKIFFESLPSIKEILITDIEAIYNKDPSCLQKEEIILSYNTFFAIFTYRIANKLSTLNVPLIPRLLTEYAHSKTGIDINPKATIGKSFFIDHGTGVVIGETTIIKDNVSIYQGVTLGAINLNNATNLKNTKRHPTINNNVIIYANSTILGGKTIIGENSIIGASCFITKSISDNSKVSLK